MIAKLAALLTFTHAASVEELHVSAHTAMGTEYPEMVYAAQL